MSATTAPSKRSDPDEPGGGNSSEVYYNEKLGCGLSCAYGFFRVPVSAYDLAVRPARTAVYIEALNHSIIIHAMTVALCKSFDFLLGFVVGTASDNTPTRWGRRKPWVVVCFPLGCLSAFFLLYPIPWVGNVLVTTDSTAPCASVAADNATSCDALRVCIDAAIANGSLPAPDSASHDVALQATRGDASVGLSVWFGAWYFTYYFFSWTCTMIPYDALGMELTSDYKARVSLFSIKAGFHFSGYVLPNICGFVLARIFPTNIVAVYAYTAVILAVFGVAALLVLGCCVTERPSAKEGKGKSVPPVVALRRALSNRPYLIYLAIKFPIALFGLMPINLLSYFLRYGMLMENWADTYFLGLIVGLFVSVLSIPAVWALARRFGKREILLWFSAFGVPVLIAIFFIPPASMPVAVLYVIVCISAIFAVLSFVVLDAMLADIIDYDTLRTGKRSEAVYAARAAAREGRPRLSAPLLPRKVHGCRDESAAVHGDHRWRRAAAHTQCHRLREQRRLLVRLRRRMRRRLPALVVPRRRRVLVHGRLRRAAAVRRRRAPGAVPASEVGRRRVDAARAALRFHRVPARLEHLRRQAVPNLEREAPRDPRGDRGDGQCGRGDRPAHRPPHRPPRR